MIRSANILRRRLLSTAAASSSSSSTPPLLPWLFVGLGNPGDKYTSTRHNVGFDMIDAFARSQGIQMNNVHFNALFGEGMVGGQPVLLAKPQTYMNLSGESAGPLAEYYQLPLNRILLIFDCMDLPCGVLRIQPKGGLGKHKGVFSGYPKDFERLQLLFPRGPPFGRVRSVIYHLRRNQEFARLRIGIGRPPGQMDPKAFLLQKFNNTAREMVDMALQDGVGMLKLLITKGLTECARCANPEQKYKHLRLQTLRHY